MTTQQTPRRTAPPARGGRRWWVIILVVAVVAVVVVLAVAGAGLVLGGGTSSTSTEGVASPTPTSASTDASPAGPAPSDVAAPVYVAGPAARGERLFREFQALQSVTPQQELQRAVQASVGGTPADDDYHSLWPGGTTASVTSSGADAVTVDLRGSSDALLATPSDDRGTIALQAVVYTVDAVLQRTVPVTFTVDGRAVPSVLGVDTSAPVQRADPLAVQAPVWITTPTEGARVASTIAVRGVAATFEANVVWELKQGSRVVRQGHATATECCKPSPYRFTIKDVPAGSYTLVVHDSDESGAGKATNEDTKTITVG